MGKRVITLCMALPGDVRRMQELKRRNVQFGNVPQLMLLPEHMLAAPGVRRTKWRGHAAQPGTGPQGETCGGCEHRARVSKCALAKARWTHGAGSDIRMKDAACRLWTRKESKS
jgi:hypothetical protein